MLANYQDRFRYILVDEYQDTNVAVPLAEIAWRNPERTSPAWGDDDQSIYGWRGAEVDNILRFEHDFRARWWCAWSATTAPRATSWRPPPG